MPDYAQEKNKFDCACMGERNKRVLTDVLSLEKARLKQFEQALLKEQESRKHMRSSTEFEANYKRSMLENSEHMISSVRDSIIHANTLFDAVRYTETCGD